MYAENVDFTAFSACLEKNNIKNEKNVKMLLTDVKNGARISLALTEKRKLIDR